MKSSRDIIQLLPAVDITMRPNVQRLIERNVKSHVTFFRQIRFKISIWVCNKQGYTWCLSKNLVHPSSSPIFSGVRVTQSLLFFCVELNRNINNIGYIWGLTFYMWKAFTCPFIDVLFTSQGSERSCICVLVIPIMPLSPIFSLNRKLNDAYEIFVS